LKEIYKGFAVEVKCKKVNGEWEAEISIAPNARGVSSIVPVFGYNTKSKCRSAAFELAKEHINRITNPPEDLSQCESNLLKLSRKG
jgi:hypothetical protein